MKDNNMKTKLIQTKVYLLLIDEEAEIKEGDYRFHIYEKTLNHPVHRLEHGENTFDNWKLVIAYHPLTKEAKELDLPLLPNPFEEIDIYVKKESYEEELLKKGWDKDIAYNMSEGYLDALEEIQSKQFSLEDVEKAIDMATRINPNNTDRFYSKEEIIQSLSTQQLTKEFIPEYINTNSYGSETNGYDSGNFIPKTITNSEGKKELVGTYKY